ncbi:MAG: phosphodiester glycosidase family protein, partial [Oscillospiraceae bacterium]|nr:phosphodiester glycosidase family protein [Oscillospiraceae bacterium]
MKRLKSSVAILMLFAMLLSVLAPVAVLAEEAGEKEPAITEYSVFLEDLKVLEGYADSYAAEHPEDASVERGGAVALVLNYIRTGVKRYSEDAWNTLAGKPNTAFIAYVAEKDAERGTSAGDLRSLGEFKTPDGLEVEFEHMFGAMDMGYYNPKNADFGSWAGDLVDLMQYSYNSGLESTELEEMADEIRNKYLGVDDPHEHSFGWRDVFGDLDANYFLTHLKRDGGKLSALMEDYYTIDLTEEIRAINFLNDNFGRDTQEGVRAALLKAYEAAGTVMLESSYGVYNVKNLREAACYAFADYLFALADGHLLSWGNEQENPDDPKDPGEDEENPYYSVFSSSMSTLAPGVTQEIKYAQTRDKKQIVYYIATADITRPDVSVHANYKNNVGTEWGFSSVTDQMAAALERHSDPNSEFYVENYNPVVGVNGDFFNMMNARPSGALVMEGVVYQDAGNEPFFAILKDGTPFIGTSAQWAEYKSQVQEAIGASSFLVKDGELAVTAGSNYYTSRASRTCVGITADNKVVLMVLDGRQEPFSAGGSAIEIAQIMLDAGCVMALNLDGGGSTTFAAKPEGADDVTVVNRPSDGFARGVSSSLMVVSTAVISYDFDHASISTQYDYMTKGAEQEVSYIGVSSSGNAAEIPEGAMLKVSDSSLGYMEGNVFHATGLGEVEIQFVLADGTVAGSKTLNIVEPNGIRFEREHITAIYGVPMTMPVLLTYEGIAVAACGDDVLFMALNEEVGTFDGFTFYPAEEDECSIRTTTVGAMLSNDYGIYATATINFFKASEAAFDFDNADGGDRSLAWNREVTNSEKILSDAMDSDEVIYHILTPGEDMEVSYIFALDMNNLNFPENIEKALPLLAGFLDAPDDVTPWQLLLVLAERVSPSSTVTVTVNIDPNMEVLDYEHLVFNCECFEQTSVTWNEETHQLTLVCNWINRTDALDVNSVSPIVSLSGIKLKAKENASYDENNQLKVTMSGTVEYDARIRSSQAFNIAGDELGQQFGLYQYDNSENLADDKGAGFKATHCEFDDAFTLDITVLEGWQSAGDNLWAYYVNNQRQTGIQLLPDRRGGEENLYYEFDENGVCLTPMGISGLFKMEDDLYYAILGVLQTGWVELTATAGVTNTYYFYPDTGAAADGNRNIDGFNFVFTDHVLTRGDLLKTSSGYYQYRWGSRWVIGQWFELDGNKYFAAQQTGYLATGVARVLFPGGSNWGYFLFDETAVWQETYNGIFRWSNNNRVYFIENGQAVYGKGLVKDGEDYYYFLADALPATANGRFWVGITNNLMKEGYYWFDSDSKLITAKYTVTWVNWDNTVLETDKDIPYGETPKYDGKTPTRTADDQYTYTFAGWSPEVSMVTGDVTYKAVFKTTTNTYTITWLDEDGTELAKTEVAYGAIPEYPNGTPTKAGDEQYSYTFAGWDPAVTAVTGPATYTATYTKTVNKYTVTWVDWNGTVLEKDENVPYGTIPTYDSADPTRPADAQYTYTWTGWDPAISEVTGNITYKATYTATVNKYTVTWVNWNGDVLETDVNVSYGEMPKYDGATPTRPADAQYTYTFKGWDPAISEVTGNITYKATYTATVNTYTVKWVDENGDVLETDENVPYGTMPKYDGATPTKAGNAKYTYTFAGWDPEVSEVKGDITYKATYTATVNTYTVTWVNWDDSVLETDENVPYGEMPKYDGATPTREADTEYTYTFAYWTPNLSEVTGNVTYKAVYSRVSNGHTVIWKNWNGDILEMDEDVPVGEMPEYNGKTPTRPATAQYTYTFAGWDKELAPVTEDVIYTATFKATVNTYTVKWVNEDGTVLETDENVPYGEMPQYDGFAPTKEGNAQYTYTFKGWDKDLAPVTGDVTYTATYTETVNVYTVTWVDEDGSVLKIDRNVPYGTRPVYTGAMPTKEGNAQYTYTFAGWTPAISEVTGNVTYKAVYTETVNEYIVTWNNYDGTLLKRELVRYGEMPVYTGVTPTKRGDAQFGYTFAGWTPVLTEVTEDVTYTATYREFIKTYTVIWKNGNEILKEETLLYGSMPAYDGAEPTRVYTSDNYHLYVFAGWTPAISEVTGDVTYSAVFEIVGLNGWFTEEEGTTYLSEGVKAFKSEWATIGGNAYYFDENGYIVTGLTEIDGTGYVFDENGVFLAEYN